MARTWQMAEGALVFLAGIALYIGTGQPFAWWAAILYFFAPDLSFVAFLAGPAVGARVYNAVHIYGFGTVLLAAGGLLSMPWLAALAALWLAHCGFDRMLGYGLKLPSGFQDTHLGRIGRG